MSAIGNDIAGAGLALVGRDEWEEEQVQDNTTGVSGAASGLQRGHQRYAWALVAMLWVISFLNYADRSVLSAVMPQIRTDFQLSPPQLALLSSSFLWVYAIAASFAGYLGDRFSRKRVILMGLVAWSLMTFLTPLAGSFVIFVMLRALTGLGEASYYPSGTALMLGEAAALTVLLGAKLFGLY